MAKRLPEITLVRVYEVGQRDCGYRILVDRLWPRGLKKEDLHIDEWAKELGPSTALRQWFGHRPERWEEFRKRYTEELRSRPEEIERLLKIAATRRVALLFGARDVEHNQAVVLREFLQSKLSAPPRATVPARRK
jgi:uncharacterized protein YeaO (DUF488 family)